MRQSKAWKVATARLKGRTVQELGERSAAFKDCNEHYCFTEYPIQAVATIHRKYGRVENRLGAQESQAKATRAFSGAVY